MGFEATLLGSSSALITSVILSVAAPLTAENGTILQIEQSTVSWLSALGNEVNEGMFGYKEER